MCAWRSRRGRTRKARQNTNCVCRRFASDIFLRSSVLSFVMPGHSRSQNGVAKLAYAGHPCGSEACAALPPALGCGSSAWTTGSSPVVTSQRRCLT